MRNVSCAMIWLVRLCILPTKTLDDANFWAPAGQPRRLTWGSARARRRPQKEQPKKSSPQASPETQMQQNTVHSSVLWLGSRARAPTDGSKTKRTEQQPAAQHSSFCRFLQRFVERGPSIAGVPGSARRYLLKISASWVEGLFGKEILMMQTKPR